MTDAEKQDFLNKYKTLSNSLITQKENILVLPINTLRIVDVILQLETDKMLGKEPYPFEETIYRVVMRKIKDIGEFNDTDSIKIYSLLQKNMKLFYDMAPRSYFYDLLDTLINQKFVTNTYILFDNKELSEDYDKTKTIYYDGTIEELVKIIKEKNITCIMMSDIDLLYNLIKNTDIDWYGKTVFIANYGFNHYIDPETKLVLTKHIKEINDLNLGMDLGLIDPVTHYSKEILKKYSSRKDEK